jgi:hypothetical protein
MGGLFFVLLSYGESREMNESVKHFRKTNRSRLLH